MRRGPVLFRGSTEETSLRHLDLEKEKKKGKKWRWMPEWTRKVKVMMMKKFLAVGGHVWLYSDAGFSGRAIVSYRFSTEGSLSSASAEPHCRKGRVCIIWSTDSRLWWWQVLCGTSAGQHLPLHQQLSEGQWVVNNILLPLSFRHPKPTAKLLLLVLVLLMFKGETD